MSSDAPPTPLRVDQVVAHAEFLARGELAWQEYLRTGQSYSLEEVFGLIHERVDKRRQELLTQDAPSPASDVIR